jgi:hypothetical protein
MRSTMEWNSLERRLVGRRESVKDEADDDALPRLADSSSLGTRRFCLLAELGELALDHVSDVEHESMERSGEEDLVLVVGSLRKEES